MFLRRYHWQIQSQSGLFKRKSEEDEDIGSQEEGSVDNENEAISEEREAKSQQG